MQISVLKCYESLFELYILVVFVCKLLSILIKIRYIQLSKQYMYFFNHHVYRWKRGRCLNCKIPALKQIWSCDLRLHVLFQFISFFFFPWKMDYNFVLQTFPIFKKINFDKNNMILKKILFIYLNIIGYISVTIITIVPCLSGTG